MGFQFKDVCYPTAEAAKQASCAAQYNIWGNTTTVYSSDCTSTAFTGSSMTVCKRTNGGACTNVTVPYPTFQPCTWDNPASLSSEYFGAVLAFLVIVWVGSRMYRLFWKSGNEAI